MLKKTPPFHALVPGNVTIGVFATHFANGKPIRVSVTFIESIRFVVNLLRRIADALLPVFRPVQVFILQLGRCFSISTDDHTVDHAADQCSEAEDQEYHTQDPNK